MKLPLKRSPRCRGCRGWPDNLASLVRPGLQRAHYGAVCPAGAPRPTARLRLWCERERAHDVRFPLVPTPAGWHRGGVDDEQRYQAATSKDARFDGVFFIAVSTTGIYCRPSCPAITPKRRNVRFFTTAAAAQEAGFRACKRCRPDAAPGSPDWDARADLVARAVRLIGDGAAADQT